MSKQILFPHQHVKHWAETKPDDTFLRQIIDRQFVDFSFLDVYTQARKMVTKLHEIGLQPGDKVAVISKNCAEWFITDLALMLGDFISVPIFPTAGSETIEHVLTHSESKVLFIGKLDSTDALKSSLTSLESLTTISFPYKHFECEYLWDEILNSCEPAVCTLERPYSSVMSIVYTSGTSGLPKGALLTYGSFAWTSAQIISLIKILPDDKLFSYLPLAHITERVYILGTSMTAGLNVAFPESLDTFIDDVKMQQPTVFISVPRLWTLFQQKILEKLPQRKLNVLLKIPFISTFLKNKLAKGLGLSNCRVLGCGSAPVSSGLLKWYESVGMNISEAWGMTESFAYSTINYPYRADKVGTVGISGPGIDIKIASDEEILVRSEGIFTGYYKNQQATDETVIDNWLHTGDIGALDSDGYLSILGRKKDNFKTAKGKFVCPVPIERRLFDLSSIELMCVVGSGMPAPILLAIPHAIPNFDHKRFERKLHRVLKQINSELESHAKIAGTLVIDEPWSIDNGILTPTLKIKRHLLEKKYHDIGAQWPKGVEVQWESEL
jgi:long-subunit acyl-CoA synthetase (AMP-forming)